MSADSVITLLSDLVAIDSVNPSLSPGAAGEREVAALVGARLARAGFDVRIDDVAPGRPNVIAIADGREPGPVRLLCGHTDTVGVDGMEAPFDPVVRDGCLYGRGAQDMKGGLAALVCAAEEWLAGTRRGASRVIVAAVADEEYASLGAEALVAAVTADAAVIPEPTGLELGIAHKGFSCAEIVVDGVAAHGSRPREGRDAILRMGRLLTRLEALNRRLLSAPPDALLETASLHASIIAGGTAMSVYPSACTLQVERRTLPGEALDVAARELEGLLQAVRAEDPEVTGGVRPLTARPAYAVAPDARVVRELAAAAERCGIRPVTGGLSYWTDAAVLGAAGVPTVLFGPGGAGLHGPGEHVRLDDVERCRDVLRVWLETG